MTDIKLPPLPASCTITYEFPDGAYDAEGMIAYGRACYEAAQSAKIEALRAEWVDLEQFRMLAQGAVDALKQNRNYPADVNAAIGPMRHLLALIDGRNVRSSSEHEICGGCGNGDPDKRCLGCLHDFGSKAGEVQP